ncbi:MAG: DUF4142 domain-containing protein [Beijerinckiaceae bacterium]
MKPFVIMSATAFFIASPALAQSATPANDFLAEAIQGDNAEVQMGKLASSRGGSKDVRDFGKMLVRDHTKGGQEARKLARQLKVKAPNDAPPDAAEMKAALSKLKGAEFDREFAAHMVDDHKKDIDRYQQQADGAADPKVKDFAARTLPVLHKHLDAAQKLSEAK